MIALIIDSRLTFAASGNGQVSFLFCHCCCFSRIGCFFYLEIGISEVLTDGRARNEELETCIHNHVHLHAFTHPVLKQNFALNHHHIAYHIQI